MAHIIAVANQKGGVGKTTTTVNLGACLANLGKKILIVDADAQGNATSGVGVQKAQVEKDIYDVLVNEEPITEAILPTKHKNMSIVPATIQLAGAEIELTSQMAREMRLKLGLHPVEDQYDYILIDCPPSLGQFIYSKRLDFNPGPKRILRFGGLKPVTKHGAVGSETL